MLESKAIAQVSEGEVFDNEGLDRGAECPSFLCPTGISVSPQFSPWQLSRSVP
ncbi:MAG: hypothetical protein HC925_09790 [Coleofasciculaceae cyanobacterium SM2_3_26]|nr:hypothetical protein [Coleofasciculaceae cyanobacterium SM2_3_26]